MNTSVPPNSPGPESATDKLAQLVAKAGPRTTPPAVLETEVRAAVHAEWLHLTQARKVRQQRRWLSAAAVLLVAVGTSWLALNRMNDTVSDSPAMAIASVTQVHGTAMLNDAALTSGKVIRSGEVLLTQADGGLRVALTNGISVRIDRNTQLRWLDSDELQLQQGAVYVDSHDNAAALTIHTEHGNVTHLGTRYLVDADAQHLRVAVREGKVAIHTGTTELRLDSLQQVQLNGDGLVQRSDLSMNDALWQWADTLAQPFALENRSIAEFLQWVSRETGYELRYKSKEVQQAAALTLLHGGPTTQAPLQALQTVLAATDFQVNMQGGQLFIEQAR